MSPSKPANPVGNYAVGSAIAALILLGPVPALLMVAAAEMLIDLLIVGGNERSVCSRRWRHRIGFVPQVLATS